MHKRIQTIKYLWNKITGTPKARLLPRGCYIRSIIKVQIPSLIRGR